MAPCRVVAQGTRRARLGYLSGGSRSDESGTTTIDLLTESLRPLGWRVGETLEVEERWANGDFAIMPRLARELVALKPDVLASTGGTETKALQEATQTIPIVFLQLGADPVSFGFVKSIARPEGNITGFMQGPQLLWGKRIELLTELLGRQPRRLAWLGNPGNNGSKASWADAQAAAAGIGSEVTRVDVALADEIERAFQGLIDREAVLVQYDFLLSAERRLIAVLAARQRLPAIYENRIHPLAGGLISYGGDLRDNYRQGAFYVHRILNRTPIADLPVVQASRFELVINLKAVDTLGLAVPESLLARVNEVIE
jgi:putative tryptophan/tyrosine transport system substrate-binding protein